jgi:hypothetical protein
MRGTTFSPPVKGKIYSFRLPLYYHYLSCISLPSKNNEQECGHRRSAVDNIRIIGNLVEPSALFCHKGIPQLVFELNQIR